ncbi:MAG TPA: lysophospholipid acyltransferase family protein [Terriglobales bacterium]|nr:lysophospholipid acyltransferase family protein [Terriglobales bacterium]
MDESISDEPRLVETTANDSIRSFSFRERLQLFFITWAGYLLIRLIGPTLRVRVQLEPGALSDGRHADRAIWCFWHRCVIPASYQFRNLNIAVMTSRSFDGEYIARIIEKLGFAAVRGSSSRGAVGALLGMRRELEMGHPVAFTIDGPRGPRYVAKPGPVLLAKKTGVPIDCFYVAPEKAWVLNSWDRMLIPKPFSRACVYMSSPILVPGDASDELVNALHQQMQETLERCREGAEAACKA